MQGAQDIRKLQYKPALLDDDDDLVPSGVDGPSTVHILYVVRWRKL